jgi:hypothetical protein
MTLVIDVGTHDVANAGMDHCAIAAMLCRIARQSDGRMNRKAAVYSRIVGQSAIPCDNTLGKSANREPAAKHILESPT